MSLRHQKIRATLHATDFSPAFWQRFEERTEQLPGECAVWRPQHTALRKRMQISGVTTAKRQVTVHPRVFAALRIAGTIPAGLSVVTTCDTEHCIEHVTLESPDGTRQLPRPLDEHTKDVLVEEVDRTPKPVSLAPRDVVKKISVCFNKEEYQLLLRAAAVYFQGPPNLSGFIRRIVLEAAYKDKIKPTLLEKKEAIAAILQKQLDEAPPSPVEAFLLAQQGELGMVSSPAHRPPAPPPVESPVMTRVAPAPAWPVHLPPPPTQLGGGAPRSFAPPKRAEYLDEILQDVARPPPLRPVVDAPTPTLQWPAPMPELPTLPRPAWLAGAGVPAELPPIDED